MELLAGLRNGTMDHADAVVVGTSATSREQLLARAAATAGRLTGAGPVAVHGTATLETVVAVVAALEAGTPVVPVPADVGAAERDHILRDSGARVAVGAWPWEDAGIDVVPLARAGGRPSGGPASGDGSGVGGAESTAMIVYTSGTTGPPKGVVLSRAAIATDLDALAEAWQWTAEDHLVHGLPLYHVHGLVLGVLGALRVGCRLTHTVRPTPAAYAAGAGTLYFGVPTVWSRVGADPEAAGPLAGARLLVSGSAPLPVETFNRLRSLTGHEPVERYGMTETLITLSTRADGERRAGWVGWPLAGIGTRVVTDDGGLVDPGQVGELQVRGPTLFDGYVGGTAALTADGWFATGDAACTDPSGCHRIIGRISTDLIKTGGYRVGAGEVEDALLDHPAVVEAAVTGRTDADLGQRIVAYVVCDGVTAAELQDWVARRLSAHKRPREVHLVASLPRNALGKVQKAVLRDQASG